MVYKFEGTRSIFISPVTITATNSNITNASMLSAAKKSNRGILCNNTRMRVNKRKENDCDHSTSKHPNIWLHRDWLVGAVPTEI